MGKKLSAIRQDVIQILQSEFGSENQEFWKEDELNQYIREAVRMASVYTPREIKATATSDGTRDVDLSTDITTTDFDLEMLLQVLKAEYKTGQYPQQFRNVTRFGDIATLDITTAPTSGESIYLYCQMVHKLTEDESTIPLMLEDKVINASAGISAINKSLNLYNQAQTSVAVLTTALTQIGSMTARITQCLEDINKGRTEAGKVADAVDQAGYELDLIEDQVNQAVDDLTSGRADIGEITVGDTAQIYAQYSRDGINNARGYVDNASGYLREASGHEGNAAAYQQLAAHELSTASQYLNQAMGNIRAVSAKNSLAAAGRYLETWGQNKLNQAKIDLKRMSRPAIYTEYSRS
jgi:hypothetical protein